MDISERVNWAGGNYRLPSLGLLGRLYLSGHLPQLSQDQWAPVRQAVAMHRELRGAIRSLVPRWPLGLPG
jgi:alpha-galactosidase